MAANAPAVLAAPPRRVVEAWVPMGALRLLYWPDPLLRKKSDPVLRGEFAPSQVAEMFRIMEEHRGVGLAAPQVGILKRLFVMNTSGRNADRLLFVNPRVLRSHGRQVGEEGCLSFPEVYIQVERAREVRVWSEDLRGAGVERDFADLAARAVLHEIDHLEGILLADRMSPTDRLKHRQALRDLEERHRRAFHA